MVISNSICLLVITVFAVAMPQRQRESYRPTVPLFERHQRYPLVEDDEVEAADPLKLEKLKKWRQRYNKDSPFGARPGARDTEVDFLPEFQFDFPGFPVSKSDAIVIGEVLSAAAHRSASRNNVFSNFEVRVDEVLKGQNLSSGLVINVQRLGGHVKYADGQTVLFKLGGNGMPLVGARYAFFLKSVDEDYTLITGYEFGSEGVMALDNSNQFLAYERDKEIDFMLALRKAVSEAVSQPE